MPMKILTIVARPRFRMFSWAVTHHHSWIYQLHILGFISI